jgi:D-alanyl-D-alanine carboxypeptidase
LSSSSPFLSLSSKAGSYRDENAAITIAFATDARAAAGPEAHHNYDGRVIHDAVVAAVDAAVQTEMERSRQPGLTLGLTDQDSTLVIRTYGFADLASRQEVTPETLFEIGSIGKTFTAVAILQLVDEGRIDLEAPVDRYLPWFAVPQQAGHPPITIAHLLSHTAGLVAGIDGTPEAAFQVWSLRDLPTFSAPGERFHYSNVGYKALGLVLEAVEARPYREVIRARILDPLDMSATEPAITHDIRSRLAVGYEYLHDDRIGYPGAQLAPATWLETETADGSIASTAADMCAFVRLLLREGEGPRGRLLSERAFAEMTAGNPGEDEPAVYGYGLVIRELEGHRLIGHGGGMVGYLAGMQADPEAGLGVIVLQNGMSLNPMALARTVLPIARDEANEMTPPTTATATWHEELVGTYVPDEPDSEPIEIVAGKNGPVLRSDGRELALEVVDDDVLLVPDAAFDRFRIRVERQADGVTELWHGGRRYVREGTAARQLLEPSDELRSIAGHYRSHNPWTTNFRVVLREDRPWLTFAAAPDGFDDEQPLVPLPDGSFRAGEDPGNPEGLRFDTVVDGRALRAWLSGWPYYRAD